MSRKATISIKDQKNLHTKSGNRCAICKCSLVDLSKDDSACIGQNAHIYGEKPGAARYDYAQDEEFVNSERNLIYVCGNCHKKIDTEYEYFSVERLFKIKREHELWVEEQLSVETNKKHCKTEIVNQTIDWLVQLNKAASECSLELENSLRQNNPEERCRRYSNYLKMLNNMTQEYTCSINKYVVLLKKAGITVDFEGEFGKETKNFIESLRDLGESFLHEPDTNNSVEKNNKIYLSYANAIKKLQEILEDL